MRIAYHKDIKLYITIEELERIKLLFKNVKGIKSRMLKLMINDNQEQLHFHVDDCKIANYETEKEEKNEETDEKKEKEKEKEKEKNEETNEKKEKEKEKEKDMEKKTKDHKGEKYEKQENEKREIKTKETNEIAKLNSSELALKEKAQYEEEGEKEREKEEKEEKEEDDETKKEKKRKSHETIFNDKCTEDEYDIISKEIFKSFFPGEDMTTDSRYKLIIELITQTIIYADEIKLNIYKLNLFISILIMTLYKMIEHLGKRNRRKNVLTYFAELLETNTSFTASENGEPYSNLVNASIETNSITNTSETVKDLCKNEKEGASILQKENIPAENSKQKEKREKVEKGNCNTQNVELKQENNEEKICQEEKEKEKEKEKEQGEGEEAKREKQGNGEDNIQRQEGENADEANKEKDKDIEIILFNFLESKYIAKYMFDNIFYIYNIYEYIFLFAPIPMNLSFIKYSSFATPNEYFKANDKIDLEDTDPNQEANATKIFIKKMLDIPIFVLDKFYDHIEDLTQKIDDIIK